MRVSYFRRLEALIKMLLVLREVWKMSVTTDSFSLEFQIQMPPKAVLSRRREQNYSPENNYASTESAFVLMSLSPREVTGNLLRTLLGVLARSFLGVEKSDACR